jgi:hypothetical protein
MALPPDWLQPFLQGATASASQKQPPVLFVHMPRDTHTATAVAAAVKLRQELVSCLLCVCARWVSLSSGALLTRCAAWRVAHTH